MLSVRHTEAYSDRRFAQMPFQSMFGLANLLKEYGVGTAGVKVPEQAKEESINRFPTPFLADTPQGFAIVQKASGHNVTYMTQGETFTAPTAEFIKSWNGIALLAAADSSAIEPDYTRHHIGEMAKTVKYVVLWAR